MKRIILVLTVALVMAAMVVATAAPAFAAFKFGPHATQCQANPDQPNCVGSH
jgi:hypothetical protein